MMKVKDLLKILEGMNGEDPVIVSSDPEGNSYSPLGENCVAPVIFRSYGHCGDVVEDQERQEGDVDAVCFWPA